MDSENTIFFKVEKEKKSNSKQILKQVYEALVEKGYNPINQIVGYILSGDPTYITSYKDSRSLITIALNLFFAPYIIQYLSVICPIDWSLQGTLP